MLRVLTVLLVCVAAQAATTSATLTVNATLTASSSGTTYVATGTATLTGGISGTGTFSANIDLTTLESGGSTPFTITLSGGSLGGSLTIPLSVFTAILGGADVRLRCLGDYYQRQRELCRRHGFFPFAVGIGRDWDVGYYANLFGNRHHQHGRNCHGAAAVDNGRLGRRKQYSELGPRDDLYRQGNEFVPRQQAHCV